MDLYGPPKVGADCLSYCGKCKIELAHVIVSMTGNRPAKVVCKTCKSQHNFKGAPSPLARRSTTSKPKVERTSVKASDYWEQQMAKAKAPEQPYSPKSTFKKGDVVMHAQFGAGLVEEVQPKKITVIFRVGDKILVHGL